MVVVFSKKVSFIADLHKNYVCRSALTPVEKCFSGVPFPFSGEIG